MNDDPLLDAFSREFATLDQRPPVTLVLTPTEAWCVMSAVQLAARHPRFTGPTRQRAEQVARELQARLATTPVLAEVAEMGWNPNYDTE